MWGWVEHAGVGGAYMGGGVACGSRWSMWEWVEHVEVGGACGDGWIM